MPAQNRADVNKSFVKSTMATAVLFGSLRVPVIHGWVKADGGSISMTFALIGDRFCAGPVHL